jgi:hypothetical protein
MQSVTLTIKSKKKEILKKKLQWVNPANMVEIKVNISDELLKSKNTLEVAING